MINLVKFYQFLHNNIYCSGEIRKKITQNDHQVLLLNKSSASIISKDFRTYVNPCPAE